MNCYCHQQYNFYGDAGLKMIFSDGQQYCGDWYYTWIQARYIAPSMAVWISLMNFLIIGVLSYTGTFYRARDVSEYYKHIMHNIFLAIYVNTAIIILLAQNSFLWNENQRA